jgi:hypothetical protein
MKWKTNVTLAKENGMTKDEDFIRLVMDAEHTKPHE